MDLDTKGEAALYFRPQWSSKQEPDILSSVRAKPQEQVKVIPQLKQCRIGNVSTKDPLLPPLIRLLLLTKDMQA